MFHVLQVCDFRFYNYPHQQTSHIPGVDRIKYYVIISFVHRYGYLRTLNQTGIELVSLNSIPPTWRSFVFLIDFFFQYGLYMLIQQQNFPLFHFGVVAIYGHRASPDSLTT